MRAHRISFFVAGVRRPLQTLVWAMLALLLVSCASTDRPRPTALESFVARMDVRVVWQAKLGAIGFPMAVRVVGDTAYLADSNGTVVAVNAQTGADVWRTPLDTPLSAGVGSDGRYTAVVSSSNDLVVLEQGKVLWRQRLAALTQTAPLVAGARVFVLTSDRSVIAFDAASGRKLWQQQRSGDALVLGQSGLLTAVGDTLVVGFSGRVVGMNPGNGASRWEAPVANSRGTNEVERLADVVSGFSRFDDQLCVRSFQYAVSCFDGRVGNVIWTKVANGSTGVAGDATGIFGVESDGRIRAYERADGSKRWESDSLRYHTLSAPMVVGKALVVGDESGNVHLFSTVDGTLLNRLQTDGAALTVTPVLVGKTLLAVSQRGGIFALRAY